MKFVLTSNHGQDETVCHSISEAINVAQRLSTSDEMPKIEIEGHGLINGDASLIINLIVNSVVLPKQNKRVAIYLSDYTDAADAEKHDDENKQCTITYLNCANEEEAKSIHHHIEAVNDLCGVHIRHETVEEAEPEMIEANVKYEVVTTETKIAIMQIPKSVYDEKGDEGLIEFFKHNENKKTDIERVCSSCEVSNHKIT